MVTQETQQFLNKFMEDNSPMSCVLVLLMTIVLLFFTPVGCLYPPPFYIQGGEVTRKVTESVTT
jgi:hypothetical protein